MSLLEWTDKISYLILIFFLNSFNFSFISLSSNKSDLLDENEINEKLKEFKKKIKTKYEIISIYSIKDLQKIKKLLIKYAN